MRLQVPIFLEFVKQDMSQGSNLGFGRAFTQRPAALQQRGALFGVHITL